MGASLVYLEKPNKDIEFELGENANFKFAAGGMQGWRINMVSLGGPASTPSSIIEDVADSSFHLKILRSNHHHLNRLLINQN